MEALAFEQFLQCVMQIKTLFKLQMDLLLCSIYHGHCRYDCLVYQVPCSTPMAIYSLLELLPVSTPAFVIRICWGRRGFAKFAVSEPEFVQYYYHCITTFEQLSIFQYLLIVVWGFKNVAIFGIASIILPNLCYAIVSDDVHYYVLDQQFSNFLGFTNTPYVQFMTTWPHSLNFIFLCATTSIRIFHQSATDEVDGGHESFCFSACMNL